MRLFRPLPLALALASTAGCYQNQLIRSWQSPNVPAPRYSSVLVLAAVQDSFAGRIYEDALVKYAEAAGITATPGWAIMQEGAFVTKEQLEAAAVKSGAAAVLISKVVHVDVQTDYNFAYSPAAYAPGFYGLYNAGFMTYVPSRAETTTEVTVQTNIFDSHTQEVVWSGITKSYPKTRLSDESPTLAKMILGLLLDRQILAGAPRPPSADAGTAH